MTDAAVKAFVEERPGMTFVGLLATDAGFSDFLSGEGNLKVSITAHDNQLTAYRVAVVLNCVCV